METFYSLLLEFTARMGEYRRTIRKDTQRERLKDGTEMPEGHVCTQRYALHLNYVPKIQTNKTIPHRNGQMKFEASALELAKLHAVNFQNRGLISSRGRTIISASMNIDSIPSFARGIKGNHKNAVSEFPVVVLRFEARTT